jgi:hypothetical protein
MRTPMHTDARDGLLLHVRGSKRVAFAPPGADEARWRALRVTPGAQAQECAAPVASSWPRRR